MFQSPIEGVAVVSVVLSFGAASYVVFQSKPNVCVPNCCKLLRRNMNDCILCVVNGKTGFELKMATVCLFCLLRSFILLDISFVAQ